MRVVGGEWRGRPLAAPAGRATRPTADKVREAIFGVLGALPAAAEAAAFGLAAGGAGAPAGHVALDLFAGSGGLGIEALSRGAAHCTFVERERAAVKALRANLESLGVPAGRAARAAEPAWPPPARARVVAADVRRALPADAARGARYTLVFADPPYDRYAEVRPALARLLTPLLAPRAVLVVETAAATAPELPWAILREKRYGDTRVTFLVTPAGDTTKE
jgi:16S rRNA (guanine966-N2)-methyltransferase